jgi:predicted type IV restriction endonuclease
MDLRVETTSEEVEGLRIVREICSPDIDPGRLSERDTKTHSDILLDQDTINPFVRFCFFGGSKKVEICDDLDPMAIDLAAVSDLHSYSERIRALLTKKLSTK